MLFAKHQFDLIYVFFGALNTVDDLRQQAEILQQVLKPGGTLVLSFVNKWYLMGMFLEGIRFKFSRAFARIRPIWGGYSSVKYLPSRCYSPQQIKKAFSELKVVKQQGFSILHPAWYYTGINKRLARISNVLWNIDMKLNKSFLWRFGEYSLFTFKHPDGSV